MPRRIRTSDLRFRRPLLYPTALCAHKKPGPPSQPRFNFNYNDGCPSTVREASNRSLRFKLYNLQFENQVFINGERFILRHVAIRAESLCFPCAEGELELRRGSLVDTD